jgi:hypothetical protein
VRIAGALGCCRGFSVTEGTTVLTVLSILGGLAAPAVNDYVEQAKMVKAQHDVKTIGVTLVRLFDDVGTAGTRELARFDLLVGPGAPPAITDAVAARWAMPSTAPAVGFLDDHLLTNAARYETTSDPHANGWRGAYLQDRISSDPWGTRYAVNVAAMKDPHSDTLTHSAGADGRADTPFAADGLATRGDDVTGVVASTGSMR